MNPPAGPGPGHLANDAGRCDMLAVQVIEKTFGIGGGETDQHTAGGFRAKKEALLTRGEAGEIEQVGRHGFAIAFDRAGEHVGFSQFAGVWEKRKAIKGDLHIHIALACYFGEVPKEAKTGDVGRRVGVVTDHGFACGTVQGGHGAGDGGEGSVGGASDLTGKGNKSAAERLGKDQEVPTLCTAIAYEPSAGGDANDRIATLDLGIVEAVAAEDWDAGFAHLFSASAQNVAKGFRRQGVDGIAHDAKCGGRGCAHRVNIADGIGSGNLAEGKRIIHNRGKDIHGQDGGEGGSGGVIQEKNAGIVAGLTADEDAGVVQSGQIGQEIVQETFADFRSATGSTYMFREAERGATDRR